MGKAAPTSVDTQKLAISFITIKNQSKRLNELTDQMAVMVRMVEDYLTRECNVGLPVFVEGFTDIPDRYTVGYARFNGKYRIVVNEINIEDQHDVKPWTDWSRDIKIGTFKSLPDLIVKIADELENKVLDAVTTTQSVLELLAQIAPRPAPPPKRSDDDIPF